MAYLLLFVACSPSDYTNGIFSSDAEPAPAAIVPVDPATEVETEAPELTPVRTRAVSLTLELPAEGADFYELRPYRLADDEAEDDWAGRTLLAGEITEETVTLTLPRVAPRRDRAATGDGSVAYAVSLRVADENGDPGAYTGLAAERVVYFQHNAPDGASTGWNLAANYDVEPEWAPISDGISLTENLVGGETLTVSGRADVDVDIGTHLDLTTMDGSFTAFDVPIGPAWTVTLPGAPPREALTESEPVEGAALSFAAYQDVGADNHRTDEPVLGVVCLGLQEARATWYDYPYDLVRALAMEGSGLRAAWDLSVETEEGWKSVPDTAYDALMLAEACE